MRYNLPMNTKEKQSGFIRFVIMLVVVLLILSFFGFDLKSFIESPTVQHNFEYVRDTSVYVWNSYLSKPVLLVWNSFIVSALYAAFTDGLERLREGKSLIPDGFAAPTF